MGRGEIELGIHQISEMLPVKGVRVVGPLPAELQKYTTYVAVPVPGGAQGAAVEARRFQAVREYLQSRQMSAASYFFTQLA